MQRRKPVSLADVRQAIVFRTQLEQLVTESLAGRCLLWVDDHPESNELPKKILEGAGATVCEVGTTEEGLAALQEPHGRFDLVITDMGRGQDPIAGLSLLRTMRDENIDAPSIVYSDGIEAENRRTEIREAGGAGPIVGPENLVREISSLLG